MKSKGIILTFFISLFIIKNVIAQKDEVKSKYIIVSFELKKQKPKITQVFHWIVATDSVEDRITFDIYPLYIEEPTDYNLNRCINGDTVTVFSAAGEFMFSDEYKTQLNELITIIDSRKIKVQKTTLKWAKGIRGKEKVSVYITPISGIFCHCLQIHKNYKVEFKGLVYMPVSSFSFDDKFWNTKSAKIVKYADYSLVEFTGHLPSISHWRSLCRVKSRMQVFK
ncbi:hypothetical protein [Aureibacter tunicatorum]|uniref:Uncharacterized protein n=1 Tax=Aureibacter tunicatorum TaxID=866807 RepID=A0AAE3XSM3_9BACT|nr:hypothetical protein [Aureibacter tunicatorum]MDR6241358.1 hypothetical protein [Aureibacter tunicatorum]BDD06797.1 hypothetical protein AUTU_42800 [Aureibacter tunicatorum]